MSTLLLGLWLACLAGWAAPPASAEGAPDAVAARPARAAALLDGHCSYATAALIRRVLDEGASWSAVARLEDADGVVPDVAVPRKVGDDHVLANAILEVVVADAPARARLSMQGRVLETHGVRYVVLTSAVPAGRRTP